MPACADINGAMQELTWTEFTTGDQHIECSEARKGKDDQDMRSLLGFLLLHNPFTFTDMSLRNICIGITAESSVNADWAKEVGQSIIQDMAGKRVTDFKFKKMGQKWHKKMCQGRQEKFTSRPSAFVSETDHSCNELSVRILSNWISF